MNFPDTLFSPPLLWGATGLMLLLLSWAAWRVPWRTLPHGAVSAWSAACVLLAAMWLVKAGLQPGLSFHLLGAAIFTLLMGPALALLALALVLLLQVAAGQLDWLALGLNFCVTLLPAVSVTTLALRLAQRYLPAHLFVYVFVNAFLAGGLSLVVAAASGMVLLWLLGVYDWSYLLDNALPFYFLLSWSEAFTSGLVLSIMVVYRPQWVRSFDDARYLAR